MLDDANPETGEPPPNAFDIALRAISDRPVPDDLLTRCLATLADETAPQHRRRLRFWATRAAAALVLIAAVGYMARPKPADAADLLQAVKTAWTKVPASHQVFRWTRPDGERTEETWVVRHKGFRKETRDGGNRIGVVVRNTRWEFRWDIPGRTVAAWSTELASAHENPSQEGLVLDKKDFEVWAKSHRAEIVVEDDTLAGRKVQKVVLQWPSATGKPQVDTVWFDPQTLLPVKQRTESANGSIIETTIDYPAADAVAEDLFHLTMPRDVVLEINDPDLGRQIYSEAQTRNPGAER